MAGYLAKARKIDLVALVREIGLEPQDNLTKPQLGDLIVKSVDYNEDITKNLLLGITAEREEQEELVRQETERELERAKLQEERQYELRKLELQSAAQNKVPNIQQSGATKCSDILKFMSKYNTQDEISIYLTLFERQIKRLGVEKDDWMTYLLGLLPLEIVNIISREEEDLLNDYDHIRQLLLKRFKLSPEQFRQKFFMHRKDSLASYKDYAYELGNFLEEWVKGLNVSTFEGLKELLVIDQIRKRLPPEVKEHFLDDMPKFTRIAECTDKLDDYEAARNNIKKYSETKNNSIKKHYIPPIMNKNIQRNSNIPHNSKFDRNHYDASRGNFTPFKNKCFYCKEFTSHKSYHCPLRENNSYRNKETEYKTDKLANNNAKTVNTADIIPDASGKIVKTVRIRDKSVKSIVDTGSDVTMVNENLYRSIGRPKLNDNEVKLTGISGTGVSPIGYFNTDISVDNVVINCNVYVLNNLQYDMILGNNCLNKLNYEISASGFKVISERNDKKNYVVNLTTITPLNLQKLDIPSDCVNIPAIENCEIDPPKAESIYLAETVNSVNTNEIDVSHLNNCEIRKELIDLIESYKPEKVKDVDLKVNLVLSDEIPVAQRPRRLAFTEQEFVDKQTREWLEQGIIRESCSSYAAPIVLAKKKNGNLRLCIDYRKLNKKIIRDNYPLPLIDDILDDIQQSKVFSTLDLKNGFFHVEMGEESKKYTSFVTNSNQYEYNYLPFGLNVAPQHFQRYIYACLRELIRDKTILVYMDDIIVLASSEEEALVKLKRVFNVASEYGLEFNFTKCQFLKRKIEFLGYVVEDGTICPSETKILAVKNFPIPQSKKQLMSFLGLTGFFRRYVSDYAKIARPLSDLLKGEQEFKFESSQREAFETLKIKLSSKPVLHIFRRGAETELHTDASSLGFGAVLLQKDDYGNLHPIHYMSRKTTPTQSKYSSYELEALAIIEALKKFRSYLLGNKFKIITDCSAFQKTLEKKDLVPKVARWALFLQEFDYQIIHRPAGQMKHVDALSRNAVMLLTRSYDELTTKLAKAQSEDDHVRAIKTLIEKNESEDYLIRNNIVYKYENGKELIVVPENMHREIIRDVHSKGHYAIAKTEAVIKQDFYIPNIRKQIESVVGSCVECILCNRKRGKGEGLLNPIPKQSLPLQTYHIDHLGPLPSTNKNYNYIFSVVDAFTKFAWFYPVKTTSAKEAISKLKIQQAIFGNPARVVSDRGSAFTSSEFKEYLESENIEHILITTGIPRGNGQIERIQAVLIPILTKLSIDDPTKWYKHVQSVQRVMNSSCSRSTKYTPFELMIGTKLRNKRDLEIRQILDEEYENSFIKERQNNRDEARQNIQKIQEENRRNFNRKRKAAKNYKVGDLVAIQKTQFSVGAKLRPRFLGPYKVVKAKDKDRYDVEKIGFQEGPRTTSTAADNMKPWVSTV